MSAQSSEGDHRGLNRDTEAALRRVRRIARLLDSQFTLPGTRFRFGWDGILGLFPGADWLTALPGLVILLEAWRARLPNQVLLLMAANIIIDALVGTIPVLGDLFDFAFKSNQRNAELFERGLELKGYRVRRTADPDDDVIDI